MNYSGELEALSEDEEIIRALNIFISQGEPVEIRALGPGKKIFSGYYTDRNKLVKDIDARLGGADGVYFMPNPFNPDLVARSQNKLTDGPKSTTSASDITHRRWLLVDFDPVRPTGISSNDAQHVAADDKVIKVFKYLRKEHGFQGMVICDSGNGAHLYLSIDLPNTEETSKLCAKVLEALDFMFSDHIVQVDKSTSNADRISKLPGTWARKGSNTKERPHRLSRVGYVQKRADSVSREQLEGLAALLPNVATTVNASTKTKPPAGHFDIDVWIKKHEIDISSTAPWKGGTKYILSECPFNADHKKSAYIIQQQSGAISFGCLHNSCHEKKWDACREHFEPGWRKQGTAKTAQKLHGGLAPAQDSKTDALEPLYQFEPPRFPVEAFPTWLAEYVTSLSTVMQTPPDLAGSLALSVIAMAAQKKVVVKPGPNWTEQTSLYIAVIMPPAARKSPVVSALIRPVQKYEKELMQLTQLETADQDNTRKILETRLQSVQRDAAKEDPDDDESGRPKIEARNLAKQIAELPRPNGHRVLAEDVTPEMLAQLLYNNGGRMAVLSAEGEIFDIICGRYTSEGKGPNFNVFLKAYTGEDLYVDRIQRGSFYIEGPALTLGLAIQPTVIMGLLGQEVLRGRGLLARFLFVIPKNNIGYRETLNEGVPPSIDQAYSQMILKLFELKYAKTDDDIEVPHVLELSQRAKTRFDEYRSHIEVMLRPTGEMSDIPDWGGKLAGSVARIAGLLHVTSSVVSQGWATTPISCETIESAIKMGDYFAVHANAVFHHMHANPNLDNANEILKWAVRTERPEFSKRDAHRDMQSRFKKVDDLNPALQLLINLHYITLGEPEAQDGPGRPSSPTLIVDPEVFELGLTQLTQSSLLLPDRNSVKSVTSSREVPENDND